MNSPFIRFARSRRGRLAVAPFGALPLLLAVGTPTIGASAATPVVIATIPVGASPAAVAVDPVTDTIYVVNEGVTPDNTVSVIDGKTNTVTATITVGTGAGGVAVDPVTDTVYVTDDINGLYVINGATNTITATIKVPSGINSGGDAVAVDPRTDVAYIGAAASHTGGAQVDVFDAQTETFTAEIAVGSGGEDIGADPRTDRIFVTNTGGGEGGRLASFNLINGKNDKLVTEFTYGRGLVGAAATPSDDTVYILGYNETTGEDVLLAVDGTTGAITATIDGVSGDDDSANVRTNTVYVADSAANSVSVVDGKTNTVTGTVPVGNDPEALATDSATGRTYVANSGDNTVSVIQG